MLALPVADTVKRADKASHVTETVSREGLWRALTPTDVPDQSALRTALEERWHVGEEVTDGRRLSKAAGGRPKLVAGHADNIKITLPGDLALAELFLKQQEKNSE